MAVGKIINLPMKPDRPAKNAEQGVLWSIMVRAGFIDRFSYEFNEESQRWRIVITASTLMSAMAIAEQCRRYLDWEDKPFIPNAPDQAWLKRINESYLELKS